MDMAAGYRTSQPVGLGLLATLRHELGTLDRVRQVVKVFGTVSCTPEFDQQPAVINGRSESFVVIFGPDAGRGVCSAMGIVALPLGVLMEIEAVFQV